LKLQQTTQALRALSVSVNNTGGNYKYLGRIDKSPHTDQNTEKAKYTPLP